MNESKKNFIEFLIQAGCLRFGDFQLKSGDRSPFFLNLGQADAGSKLDGVGRALAEAAMACFPYASLIFGPSYKGIPLAAAMASAAWRHFEKDYAFFYDRKEEKTHGERGLYVGRLPAPGEAVVMVDDVLSDGGTKLDALHSMDKTFRTRPVGIVVVMDRRRKTTVIPAELPQVCAVLSLPDLCDYFRATGDAGQADALQRFYEGEKLA